MAKQEPYANIAKSKFESICEEFAPPYLEGLESDDPEEIKKISTSLAKDLRDMLSEEEMKGYKFLIHTLILKKGDSSLYEAWEMMWEKNNDSLAVWKTETDKYYVLIYGIFIPLKVPEDYYKQ